MYSDWQNAVAMGIVALALAYLAGYFYRRLTRRITGGCGSCGTCPSGERKSADGVPLVTLGERPAGKRSIE